MTPPKQRGVKVSAVKRQISDGEGQWAESGLPVQSETQTPSPLGPEKMHTAPFSQLSMPLTLSAMRQSSPGWTGISSTGTHFAASYESPSLL